MQRFVLCGVGVFALTNAAYMWVAPGHWYNTVPGVLQTGPLNLHFAKDVALAFFTSGAALVYAGYRGNQTAAVCGSGWLVLHAIYHIAIWVHRGFPADFIAMTNLAGIQLPAALAVWAALTLNSGRAGQ